MRPPISWNWAVLCILATQAGANKLFGESQDHHGLKVEVLKTADCGRKSQPGDTISVQYKGTLTDGTMFDSSYQRHEAFSFKLGAGEVIKGWDEGLVNMCPGEQRKLTVPPELAYGDQGIGLIPGKATLSFETTLESITTPESETFWKPTSSSSDPSVSNGSSSEQSSDPSTTVQDRPGSRNGECRLLGPFALFVQGGLGLLALSSLVWKRYRERPRRPLQVWFFDASKQVFGSVLLHIANLLMSIIPSEYAMETTGFIHASMPSSDGQAPNPCSFYLINLAIDTTVGVAILVIMLRILHQLFLLTPIARPPESIKSGNYGHPPKATWWLKQSIIYFIALLLMKLCVLAIFELLPWIAWVGDWALRWTEGSEAIQITFVMFIFPLIMNALQYYIIDAIIKDSSYGGIEIPEDYVHDESREPLNNESLNDEFAESDEPDSSKWSEHVQTKEIDLPTTLEVTEANPEQSERNDRDEGHGLLRQPG